MSRCEQASEGGRRRSSQKKRALATPCAESSSALLIVSAVAITPSSSSPIVADSLFAHSPSCTTVVTGPMRPLTPEVRLLLTATEKPPHVGWRQADPLETTVL